MAQMSRAPLKYTKEEWNHANNLSCSNAEKERKRGELIREESFRLTNEAFITAMKAQCSVNEEFRLRLSDVNFWKSELDRQYEETLKEIQIMLTYKKRLEDALTGTDYPLRISKECLANRALRIGIDLVHDDVEIQLLKEVEVIEGVQALLKRNLQQATEQIRLLRSVNFCLGKDNRDKVAALRIDSACASLNDMSRDIDYSSDFTGPESRSFTPSEWESFSNRNIIKAERERNSSATLRSIIDEILQEAFADQKMQCGIADMAFEKRINETEKAKLKLEDHLKQVVEEIHNMEVNIDSLRQAIESKESPMQVSQTRLERRALRPNAELCKDNVHCKLVDEVGEISHSLSQLKVMLATSEEALKALVRQQLRLKEDIEIKDNSLSIDRDKNTRLRNQIYHKAY